MTFPQTHHDWQIVADAGSLVVAAIATAVAYVARRPSFVAKLRWNVNAPAGILIIFVASLAVNGIVAACFGIPRPVVHDEFSYLLAADTFAHGRLTNPTPAGWEHFESPHVLMRPTYMSKYPPGQGISLALGLLIANAPIVGVWLTTSAACAAVYWTLLAIVPGRWALLGGVLATLHPQWVDWSHVYWGGGVAVLGGALMLGGWLRLMNRPGLSAAIFFAAGLAVFAISRPYEGAVLATPLTVGLMLRVGQTLDRTWAASLTAAAVVLAATVAFTLYDNYRVTGRALRPPIIEYAEQYDVYPKFWPQPVRGARPDYRNDSMRQVHTAFEAGEYDLLRTPAGLLRVSIQRLGFLVDTLVGPWVLLIALLAALWACAVDRRLAWMWITLTTFAVGLGLEAFFMPHYAAPASVMVIVLIIVGLRALHRRWPSVTAGIVVGFLAAAVGSIATRGVDPAKTGRQDLLDRLTKGRQLIFVKYLPDHPVDDEWVYNNADIAESQTIWARTLGTAADRDLLEHYPGRQVWLLSVGRESLRIDPYRGL